MRQAVAGAARARNLGLRERRSLDFATLGPVGSSKTAATTLSLSMSDGENSPDRGLRFLRAFRFMLSIPRSRCGRLWRESPRDKEKSLRKARDFNNLARAWRARIIRFGEPPATDVRSRTWNRTAALAVFGQQRKERAMRVLIGSSVAALIAIAGLLTAFVQAGVTTQLASASVVQRIGGTDSVVRHVDEMVVARGPLRSNQRSAASSE
jgi:hypothetical protein